MKKSFFFGNYFYGLCVVALSVEACLQQAISLPPLIYYVAVFCSTVIFYTKAYINQSINTIANERTLWYVKNKKKVFTTQVVFYVLTAVCCFLLLPNLIEGLKKQTFSELLAISVFPLTGLMYYGLNKKLSLRQTHWLKPFVIGFVWSGIVTLFPLFYYQLQLAQNISLSLVSIFFFVKNMMFIAVLCIMFDFKDYATDYNEHLKTFVVSFGLRKTIYYILIPLILLGFTSFLIVTHYRNFSFQKIAVNANPFILLILVSFRLTKRKSIFYYLTIIDGLMLAKALCGIIASQLS